MRPASCAGFERSAAVPASAPLSGGRSAWRVPVPAPSLSYSTETLTGLIVRLIERVEALERVTLRGLTRAERRKSAHEPKYDPEGANNDLMTPTQARAWAIAHPDKMPPGFDV